MRTFVSLTDSSYQIFFWPLFQFAIWHLLICLYTIPTLLFGRPLSRLPWGLLLNTWLTSAMTLNPQISFTHTTPLWLRVTNKFMNAAWRSFGYQFRHGTLLLFSLPQIIPKERTSRAYMRCVFHGQWPPSIKFFCLYVFLSFFLSFFPVVNTFRVKLHDANSFFRSWYAVFHSRKARILG